MIFKQIYLYPDRLDFERNTAVEFQKQSRSVCNFLERKIASLKFQAPFKRLCIIGKKRPQKASYINSSGTLITEIKFSEEAYLSTSSEDLNEFLIDMLKHGFSKASSEVNLPLDELLAGIEDFRREGYKNEWVWKVKTVREFGIKLSFDCILSTKSFIMRLRAYKKDELIHEKIVLSTEPDEIIFEPEIKKLEVNGPIVSVINKIKKPIFSMDLRELENTSVE